MVHHDSDGTARLLNIAHLSYVGAVARLGHYVDPGPLFVFFTEFDFEGRVLVTALGVRLVEVESPDQRLPVGDVAEVSES